MGRDIKVILNALAETPRILSELINEIEPNLYKKKIIQGKWSIHEHATHIAVGDRYGFQKSIKEFKLTENPIFEPLSGESFENNFFLELDLMDSIKKFNQIRKESIELALSFNVNDWNKPSIHPEYKAYTPYIMLRHLLMHDHNHLYKIEDMGFGIRNEK